MTEETLDDRIMAWIRSSIAERGGTGRRLSKIAMNIGLEEEARDRFAEAIQRLVDDGVIYLDEPLPGFIYAVPRDEGIAP